MKYLFVLIAFAVPALAGPSPSVPGCFKVHSMTRADSEHYWATWTNACPYTIDSVYVMVGFLDESRRPLGNGVWALHFVSPGTGRTIRFSMPGEVPDFHSVKLLKITTDADEALGTATSTPYRHERPSGEPAAAPRRVTFEAKQDDPLFPSTKTVVYIGDPGPSHR